MRRKKKNKILSTFLYLFSIVFCSVIIILLLNKFNVLNINEKNNNESKNGNINNSNRNAEISTKQKIENSNKNVSEPKKNEIKENEQENINNITVKLELIGEEEIIINKGEEYKDQGAKATDEQGNDVSKYINVENGVDTSKEGKYMVIYSIGKSIAIRNVRVK